MEQYAFDKLYKARQEIKKLKFTYPGFGKSAHPTSPLPSRCTA